MLYTYTQVFFFITFFLGLLIVDEVLALSLFNLLRLSIIWISSHQFTMSCIRWFHAGCASLLRFSQVLTCPSSFLRSIIGLKMLSLVTFLCVSWCLAFQELPNAFLIILWFLVKLFFLPTRHQLHWWILNKQHFFTSAEAKSSLAGK